MIPTHGAEWTVTRLGRHPSIYLKAVLDIRINVNLGILEDLTWTFLARGTSNIRRFA